MRAQKSLSVFKVSDEVLLPPIQGYHRFNDLTFQPSQNSSARIQESSILYRTCLSASLYILLTTLVHALNRPQDLSDELVGKVSER